VNLLRDVHRCFDGASDAVAGLDVLTGPSLDVAHSLVGPSGWRRSVGWCFFVSCGFHDIHFMLLLLITNYYCHCYYDDELMIMMMTAGFNTISYAC